VDVRNPASVCGPREPASIAAGISETLDRADELRGRGLARAAGFTWDATALAHDRVYEAAFSA